MMAKDYDDEIDLEQTGGFGKAAVAEAAKRPTYRSTEGQVDERDRRQEAQASMPKKKTFREAFAAARKAGDRTFMFGGKKFTTELKEEVKKPAKAEPARPASGSPKDNPYFGRTVAQRAASLKAKGGSVKMAKGGSVKSSASKRADGCAVRGKTRGRMV